MSEVIKNRAYRGASQGWGTVLVYEHNGVFWGVRDHYSYEINFSVDRSAKLMWFMLEFLMGLMPMRDLELVAYEQHASNITTFRVRWER